MEHKPLPPRRLTGQLSPRIHNGTSSLGRMSQISPVSTSSSSSNSTSHHHTQFPKTNGSLYESLRYEQPNDNVDYYKIRSGFSF